MSDTNVFLTLAQEIRNAKSIERTAAQILNNARQKVYQTWQASILNMLMAANGSLQQADINFVGDPSIVQIRGKHAGLEYPVAGLPRISHIRFAVDSDPTHAMIQLRGLDAVELVGIETSAFPKDDFEAAIVSLIRKATPGLNMVEAPITR